MNHDKKVIVIGLDGATYNVILPLIKKGDLPNLKKLIDTGAYGELKSTIPPLSGPAWASFMTGMSPGNHGAFDFIIKKEGSYETNFLNGSFIKAPSFWEVLGKKNKKVIVQNVMGTYPPKPVNGYLITCFLTPPGRSYTFPKEFQEELEEKFGEYPRAPGTSIPPGKEIEYAENIYKNMEKRIGITNYLMETKEWDLFVVLFEETDVLQHAFWKYYDESFAIKDSKNLEILRNVIPNIYKKFDSFLGELMKKIDEDTTIIILSDHGFGGLKKVILMNNVLMDKKLLVLKRKPLTQLKKLCLKYHINAENLLKIGEKMGFKIKGAAVEDKKEQNMANKFFLSKNDIDWEKTKAFSIGVGGHIFINLNGREPQGAVTQEKFDETRDSVIKILQELKDPKTGKKIMEKVYRKKEIYKGKFLSFAPDIAILPADGYFPLYKEHFISPSFLMDSTVSGGHTLNGVFIIKGKEVKEGVKLSEMSIWDVPAVVLKIFGVDNSYMDGRAPDEIFL